jgi:hypothetical protein
MKKKVWIAFGVTTLLIIVAIILGAVLGSRKTSNATTTSKQLDLEFNNRNYIFYFQLQLFHL